MDVDEAAEGYMPAALLQAACIQSDSILEIPRLCSGSSPQRLAAFKMCAAGLCGSSIMAVQVGCIAPSKRRSRGKYLSRTATNGGKVQRSRK